MNEKLLELYFEYIYIYIYNYTLYIYNIWLSVLCIIYTKAQSDIKSWENLDIRTFRLIDLYTFWKECKIISCSIH